MWSVINNSTAGCRILLKFRTWLYYAPAEAADWLKSTSGQIQDGRRRPNWNFNFYGPSYLFPSPFPLPLGRRRAVISSCGSMLVCPVNSHPLSQTRKSFLYRHQFSVSVMTLLGFYWMAWWSGNSTVWFLALTLSHGLTSLLSVSVNCQTTNDT